MLGNHDEISVQFVQLFRGWLEQPLVSSWCAFALSIGSCCNGTGKERKERERREGESERESDENMEKETQRTSLKMSPLVPERMA